ncbi:MAG: S41 family peptidase [Chitinophagales bacterium]
MQRYFLVLLQPCLLTFFGFVELKGQEPKKQVISVEALIDSLNNALSRNYIFPDKSKAISTYLKERLKQNAFKNIADPRNLARIIQQDINSVHRDRHLSIYYDPGFEADLRKPRIARVIDNSEIEKQKANNFSFKRAEILNGNIGYVEFTEFSNLIKEAKPTISAAFGFLSNTDAIIIDLRKNGGGSPWMVKHIASYFINNRMRMNDIYERRLDKTVEFWADPSEADSMNLIMPLYILTSRETFSAAEDFTYALQVAKRAIVVGDTTGGGAHPTGPVPLGQGFVVDIPLARSINYITQTDWEGVGILPDLPCNRDEALLKAQEVIFNEKMKTAKSDGERDRITWFLQSLHAHEYDSDIDPGTLRSYEGDYDRFRVFVKENKLWIDDLNGNGRKFLLKPITPTLFLGPDWFQVEFLSSNGKVSQMKMLGKPGWVNIHDKANK